MSISTIEATLQKVDELLYDFMVDEALEIIHNSLIAKRKVKPE